MISGPVVAGQGALTTDPKSMAPSVFREGTDSFQVDMDLSGSFWYVFMDMLKTQRKDMVYV